MSDFDRIRAQHMEEGLDRDHLDPDPVAQCQVWWDHAMAVGVHQPEAVALATADAHGRPSVRFVLLRGLDHDGLRFFTNYGSTKARQLDENPRGALELAWVMRPYFGTPGHPFELFRPRGGNIIEAMGGWSEDWVNRSGR